MSDVRTWAANRNTSTNFKKGKRLAVIAVAVFDLVWPCVLFAWAYSNNVELIMKSQKDPVQQVVEFTSVLVYIMLADKSVLAIFVILVSLRSDDKIWMYSCRVYLFICYVFVLGICFLGIVAVIFSLGLADADVGFYGLERLAGNMITIFLRLPDTIVVHILAKCG